MGGTVMYSEKVHGDVVSLLEEMLEKMEDEDKRRRYYPSEIYDDVKWIYDTLNGEQLITKGV